MAAELESAAAALSARVLAEGEYTETINREVLAFLLVLAAAAGKGPSSALPVGGALHLWNATVDRIAAALPEGSSAVAALRTSELPAEAAAAAAAQATLSAAAGDSPAATARAVKVTLGVTSQQLAALPAGEFGKLLTAGGGSWSWEGQGESWARTAATADLGESMLNQLAREGYTHKRWMTRYDSRVRDTHAAVDRVTMRLEELFTVGGAPMRFPADPMSGSIEQTVNCRCVLVGVRF